jgi:RNA polymerase primary sigma factor
MDTQSETPAHTRYLEDLRRRPQLPGDEEDALVAAAKRGDPGAKERLVETFLPLIASVANEYRGSPGTEQLELIQEGVVGLLRAAATYEPGRGTPFWAYARRWVRRSMRHLVAELRNPVVLPERALRRLSRLRTAHDELAREHRREPSREDVAARAGLSLQDMTDLLTAVRPPRSMQEPRVAEDGGVVGMFGDLVADPLAEGEYERAIDAIDGRELLSLLSTLSERERLVLRERYGLDGEERSRREIAEQLGVSVSRVRDIQRRALAKLAAAAGGDEAA